MRAFHFHQHGHQVADDQADAVEDVRPDHGAAACGHSHGHNGHRFSWIGVTFGLALHTFVDGIALGAAVMADAAHGATTSLYGIGVFMAIVLHKPLDALSISSLMRASGWSEKAIHLTSAGFALMCPIGAVAVLLGVQQLSGLSPVFLGGALGLSAGVFLCISLSDLLPELQFHRHDRLQLSAALLLGIALSYGVRFLEPIHAHTLPSERFQEHPHEPGREPSETNGTVSTGGAQGVGRFFLDASDKVVWFGPLSYTAASQHLRNAQGLTCGRRRLACALQPKRPHHKS
jgi:zinc and cadmium transporter